MVNRTALGVPIKKNQKYFPARNCARDFSRQNTQVRFQILSFNDFLLCFFRTNLTSMSMITEIISAILQPSTLTATTPVVPDCSQLVGPCKLDLKEIICLYFSDGIWNCIICLFCFHKKTLLSKDKKLFLQDSHLHSLLLHQWYQTGGPKQIGL